MPRSHKSRKIGWQLDRYARFFFTTAKVGGEWEQYDDRIEPLTLTLTELEDLVIAQGMTVLESFHLPSSKDYTRGMARADSLLVLYKCEGISRRFRIRFKPVEGKLGQKICEECVEKLSSYFLIKKGAPRHTGAAGVVTLTATDTESGKDKRDPGAMQTDKPFIDEAPSAAAAMDQTPQAEPTQTLDIGAVAKNLLCPSQPFPANMTSQNINPSYCEQDIPQLLNSCLRDLSFPAFVEQIEKAINDLVKNSNQSME